MDLLGHQKGITRPDWFPRDEVLLPGPRCHEWHCRGLAEYSGAVSQRRTTGHSADDREQWTTMALLGFFEGGTRIWDPSYPEDLLARLRCRACLSILGRVVYHDGTAMGAPKPVYLADVQTGLGDTSARPVVVVARSFVLSSVAIDLTRLRSVVLQPARLSLLDEQRQQALVEYVGQLSEEYPSGKIPVTADPAEPIRAVCNVATHRPKVITARELLMKARGARARGRTDSIYL